jgi:hypothetical protein
MSDPRVDPTASNNYAIRQAIKNRHPETMSALLQDPRVNLTTQQIREFINTAIEDGCVDVVSIILARFPLNDAEITELIRLCVAQGNAEMFKVVLEHIKPQFNEEELSTLMHTSLEDACKGGHHEFVLEMVTQSTDRVTAKAVESALADEELVVKLAFMHVDVFRVLLVKLSDYVKSNLVSSACRTANVNVVRELLDNHDGKFGDWTVDDFNYAALRGNVSVLRLLSLSRYGGCEKLAQNPPFDRICTRRVLGEMRVKSSRVLMWCIKKKTTQRTMAKLLDVLRDLITRSELLSYEMK